LNHHFVTEDQLKLKLQNITVQSTDRNVNLVSQQLMKPQSNISIQTSARSTGCRDR